MGTAIKHHEGVQMQLANMREAREPAKALPKWDIKLG